MLGEAVGGPPGALAGAAFGSSLGSGAVASLYGANPNQTPGMSGTSQKDTPFTGNPGNAMFGGGTPLALTYQY